MKRSKKFFCMTLTAVTVLSFLTGCQKTPDTPIVTQKDQDRMLEAAKSGGENSRALSMLEVPQHFTGEWRGIDDCVIVSADASVTLPEATRIPTAKVARRSFSQEDADKLMEVFLKGNTLYEEVYMTKQRAQEILQQLQAIQRGEMPLSSFTTDHTMEELPEMIEYAAELIRTSPDENESFPAAVTFQPDDFYDEVIEGCAAVDGKKVHICIANTSETWDKAIFYLDGYGDMLCYRAVPADQMEDPVKIAVDEEEAVRLGDTLMKELGLENVVCDKITGIAFEDYSNGENMGVIDTGYEMEYVRMVDGFPVSYTPYAGIVNAENENYTGVWAYERITVQVTQNGIVYFDWTSPYTEPVIETEDTRLLSFSDISDIFAKMIIVKNSDLKAQNAANGFDVIKNIAVSDVRLSLMRIRSKDNFSEGLLIPVWDFWGTVRMHAADEAYSDMVYDGEYYEIVLTVNAIDGTIIDRETGY